MIGLGLGKRLEEDNTQARRLSEGDSEALMASGHRASLSSELPKETRLRSQHTSDAAPSGSFTSSVFFPKRPRGNIKSFIQKQIHFIIAS